GSSARAQRFPIHTSVAYRVLGDLGWMTGRTVNVSRTGVLFESNQPTNVGASIELVLEFPFPLATVACSGRVIRTVVNEAGPWVIAATISRYSLLRNVERFRRG